MSRTGRPSKLDQERSDRLTGALRAGATRTAAVQFARIDYQTFLNWIEKGEASKSGQYFDFFEAVKDAEAAAEVNAVMTIRQAANDGKWQAAAWWLERRRPDDYKQIQAREIGGPNGDPVPLRWADEDDDDD